MALGVKLQHICTRDVRNVSTELVIPSGEPSETF